MILPHLPAPALTELGRTGGGPGTLALLVRDQDTRRLLMLRALLEAAEAAPASTCPAVARERLAQDWALLEAAEAAQAAETLSTRATATAGRPRAAGVGEQAEATDSGEPHDAADDRGRYEAADDASRSASADESAPREPHGTRLPRPTGEHRIPAARAALLHPSSAPGRSAVCAAWARPTPRRTPPSGSGTDANSLRTWPTSARSPQPSPPGRECRTKYGSPRTPGSWCCPRSAPCTRTPPTSTSCTGPAG